MSTKPRKLVVKDITMKTGADQKRYKKILANSFLVEKKLQCHGLQAKNARKFFQPLITISHEENWLFYGHIIYERSIVANFFLLAGALV